MQLTRRQVLAAFGADPAGAAASACGFTRPATPEPGGGGDAGALTFTTWGSDSELAGFRTPVRR